MKKKIFIALLSSFIVMPTLLLAQKHNVQNAAIALRNQKFADAKQYIDQSYENEKTANDAKMWNYRSKIYLQIALKQPELDANAIFKATESHLKCLQKDKKGRVIVRKWTAEEDVKTGLIQCAYKLFNTALDKYNADEYLSAIKHYSAIFDIIPLDTENQLGKITKETILYEMFRCSKALNDLAKSKEYLEQLIALKFNHSSVYVEMSNIYQEEGNTDKALSYLSLGRESLPGDQGIVNAEINLYIKLGRTAELIDKLTEAITLDPKNEILFFNRGTIYDQEGEFENAEKDYKSALEINSESFGSNYNIGALYFNSAIEHNNKANSSSNNKVYKTSKDKANKMFALALPYLEKAHQLDNNDYNTLLSLKQLYYMNGDYKKSDEMKKALEAIKK